MTKKKNRIFLQTDLLEIKRTEENVNSCIEFQVIDRNVTA